MLMKSCPIIGRSLKNRWTKILRFRFYRSFKSHVLAGSKVWADVILCSEFNESDAAWVEGVQILAQFRRHEDCDSVDSINAITDCYPATYPDVRIISTTENCVLRIAFRVPSEPGRYSLMIASAAETHSDYLIMPLISEIFTSISSVTDGTVNFIPLMPLLSSYRIIGIHVADKENTTSMGNSDTSDDYENYTTVICKEDYGVSLGSHIYDSAVILLEKLMLDTRSSLPSDISVCKRAVRWDTVLELGAGCGLTGLGLAAVNAANRVILSDRVEQQQLLQENVRINTKVGVSTSIEVLSLDWSCRAGLLDLQEKLVDQLDLIVAADVFYDKEVARLFFTAIDMLMIPGKTTVYAAQKLRCNRIDKAKNLYCSIFDELLEEFPSLNSAVIVHTEADVVVWRINMNL